MLNDTERREFEEFLRRAAMPVPPDELPALEQQYRLVKQQIAVVEAAAKELGAIEPGFRFDAQSGSPA